MIWLSGVTILICCFSHILAQQLQIMDYPSASDDGRKSHPHPTPLTGGLAILLPTLIAMLFAFDSQPVLAAIALCGLFFLGLGLLDDRQHISPVWRLGLSGLAFGVLLLAVPQLSLSFLYFSFLPHPVFLGAFAFPFTILCLLGLQNAVNMADGKNGLVLGMALIWALVMTIYAGSDLRPVLLLLSLSLLITLIFNLSGKLFLGDSGSYALSVVIGLLSLFIANSRFDTVYADQIAIWFLWPVLDCLRLIFARLMRGQGPFTPGSDHMHHRLARLVPAWTWGLLVYQICFLMPVIISILLPAQAGMILIGTVFLYALVYLYTGLARPQLTMA